MIDDTLRKFSIRGDDDFACVEKLCEILNMDLPRSLEECEFTAAGGRRTPTAEILFRNVILCASILQYVNCLYNGTTFVKDRVGRFGTTRVRVTLLRLRFRLKDG
jgi:hypothetical protein